MWTSMVWELILKGWSHKNHWGTTEFMHIMGMVHYLGSYLPTDVTHLLNPMLKADKAWVWGPAQAFTKVKQMLTETPTLAFLDKGFPWVKGQNTLLQWGPQLAQSYLLCKAEAQIHWHHKFSLLILCCINHRHPFTVKLMQTGLWGKWMYKAEATLLMGAAGYSWHRTLQQTSLLIITLFHAFITTFMEVHRFIDTPALPVYFVTQVWLPKWGCFCSRRRFYHLIWINNRKSVLGN